jgi:hypothetical protein
MVFGVLCVLCAVIPAVYVRRAMEISGIPAPAPAAPAAAPSPVPVETTTAPAPMPERPVAAVTPPEAPAAPKPGPLVVYRYTGADSGHGRVARVAIDAAGPGAALTDLRCERVHMAGDRGICLTAQRRTFAVKYEAVIFDGDFRARHTLRLTGTPSRAQVSPDGRLAAVTVFETGHSCSTSLCSRRFRARHPALT